MPILAGGVTFARFQADRGRKLPSDARRSIQRALAGRAFEPLDPAASGEDRAVGFVELEDHDATAFASGVLEADRVLFAYRVDTLRVPAAALRAELDRWASAYAKEHGRPPGRRERTARKEEVRHALRARTTPSTRVYDVSYSLASGQVLIWCSSRKLVDEIAAAIEAAFGIELRPVSARALAIADGAAEGALAPTPELVGPALQRAEVANVEA
jgi:recombination associated protein RdgC